MQSHELGYAVVEYYDPMAEEEKDVVVYFRYLPRKGDLLTIYPSEGQIIRGSVQSVEHHVEDQRRIESDITIRLEVLEVRS